MAKIKVGLFGNIYSEYSRKGQGAVDFLVKKKQGEVPNALYHKDIGWIDIVWGYTGTNKSDGFGMSKIVKYHKSIIPVLQMTLKQMEITYKSENRYKLESDKYMLVVSRFYFENKKKWLLTAYIKK